MMWNTRWETCSENDLHSWWVINHIELLVYKRTSIVSTGNLSNGFIILCHEKLRKWKLIQSGCIIFKSGFIKTYFLWIAGHVWNYIYILHSFNYSNIKKWVVYWLGHYFLVTWLIWKALLDWEISILSYTQITRIFGKGCWALPVETLLRIIHDGNPIETNPMNGIIVSRLVIWYDLIS